MDQIEVDTVVLAMMMETIGVTLIAEVAVTLVIVAVAMMAAAVIDTVIIIDEMTEAIYSREMLKNYPQTQSIVRHLFNLSENFSHLI